MFLSKIVKHSTISNYQTSSINKIISKINVLTLIKNKKVVKRLNLIIVTWFLQKINLLNFYIYSKLYYSLKKKLQFAKLINKNPNSTNFSIKRDPQNIDYIIHINLTYINTFVYLTDVKGNVKILYSAGAVNLTNKQRIKQPIALITLLKQLSKKLKLFNNATFALHFKNARLRYELFILKMLKKKFFITTFKRYNFRPHNGCRPRKLKHIKGKNIKFAHSEEMTERLKVADCKSVGKYQRRFKSYFLQKYREI